MFCDIFTRILQQLWYLRRFRRFIMNNNNEFPIEMCWWNYEKNLQPNSENSLQKGTNMQRWKYVYGKIKKIVLYFLKRSSKISGKNSCNCWTSKNQKFLIYCRRKNKNFNEFLMFLHGIEHVNTFQMHLFCTIVLLINKLKNVANIIPNYLTIYFLQFCKIYLSEKFAINKLQSHAQQLSPHYMFQYTVFQINYFSI